MKVVYACWLLVCSLFLSLGLFAQEAYVPTDSLRIWYSFINSAQPEFVDDPTTLSSDNNSELAINRLGDTNHAASFGQPTSNVSANIPTSNRPFVSSQSDGIGLSIHFWFSANFEEEEGSIANCFDYDGPNGGWKIDWQKQGDGSTELSAYYRNFTTDSCAAIAVIPQYDYWWHSATVVLDDAGITIYIDGISSGNGAWANSLSLITFPFTDPLYIGNTPSPQTESTRFDGRIDEFGIWGKALTVEEITSLNSVPATAGCNNSNACNYVDNVAVIEYDGSCSFECVGCMYAFACNYDQNATINNNDSCDFSCPIDTISIFGFLDMNANSVFDIDDTPLEYWPIHITGPNDSLRVYTERDGFFRWPYTGGLPLPETEFTLEIEYNDSQWIATLPDAVTTAIPASFDTVFFALLPSNAPSAEVKILHGFWDEVHCERGYGSGVLIKNTGGSVLDGTVRLFCDEIFEIVSDLSANEAPDSAGFGAARWDVTGLQPGSSRLYSFHTIANLGAQMDFEFEYQIQLDSNSTEVLNTTLSEIVTVNCDNLSRSAVYASPPGAYPPHNLIAPGEKIEYRVAFQNVGPNQVDSIFISTNLNSQQVEISSFEILASSTALVGCLHDDGTLQIMMSEIILPDTASDPVASTGFVVFSVQSLTENIPGDSIALNPIIYFSNDTIPNDSACYVHNIYRCSALQPPVLTTDVINPLYGFTTSLDVCDQFIDNYTWVFEGNNGWSYTENDTCAITFTTLDTNPNAIPDNFTLTLTMSSELCDTTFTNVVYTISVPDTESPFQLNVYPNPATEACTVQLPDVGYDVWLFDSVGRKVKEWNNCDRQLLVTKQGIGAGIYSVVASSEKEIITTQIVFE
jgi:hypothetical protein